MGGTIRAQGFVIKRSGNAEQDCAAVRSALQERDKQFAAALQKLVQPKGTPPAPQPAPKQSPAKPSGNWNVDLSRKRDVEERLRSSFRIAKPR
ncbi:MAG TPA: hypothetical protein VFB45_12980 [Pseudolabrys sp.]|nr:hypothetical protein [Pseudolabrys sp.]